MTGSQTTSKTMFFEWLLAMSNLANSALYQFSLKFFYLYTFMCFSKPQFFYVDVLNADGHYFLEF